VNTLSINQATTETSTTLELLDACAAAGVDSVAPWRHKYLQGSASLTRVALDQHGVKATSLCRGGFFTGTRPDSEAKVDNRRAVEEAAELGAQVLVLVCGPVTPHGGIRAAESAILHGLEELLPHALEHGVTLAVEPFHPMFAAERSAVVTLAQASRLVRTVLGTPGSDPPSHGPHSTGLGLAVDTYHVWWDPDLESSLARAADLIAAVHVADWLLPTTDLLAGRGLPGDGVIDLPGLLGQIRDLGYSGPFEVEVLNSAVWERDPAELVVDIRTRMVGLLSPVGAE
jgi:sugar phosphate isomerase/epimerase